MRIKKALLFIGAIFGLYVIKAFVDIPVSRAQIYMDPHPACSAPNSACYNMRAYNQWSCVGCTKTWRCDANPSIYCPGSAPYAPCQALGGTCRYTCDPNYAAGGCYVVNNPVVCNLNTPTACGFQGTIPNGCSYDVSSGCDINTGLQTLGCCGPGSIPADTPTPIPTPVGCNCSAWTDQGCGQGSCAAQEMYQTRSCIPVACSNESQCVVEAACGPSCVVDGFVPNPVNIPVGGTQMVTVNVTPTNGTIDRVDFVMINPAIATLAPASDSTVPYQTLVTGVSPGATEVHATVIMSGVATCGGVNPVDPVNVTNAVAWWQVINGDVITNGSIASPIPLTCSLPLCEPVFSTALLGGYPGVPTFTGTYDFQAGAGLGTASTPDNWLARASYSAAQSYDYNFFDRLVPGDTVRNNIADSLITPNYLKTQGTISPDGYKWYFRSGDLTMEGEPTLAENKVVLFVDGDLNIDGIIDLTNGRGFFMAIVSGNITVNSGVWHPNINLPELTGIFVANGNFISETDTNTLYIRGMVSAYGQVQLDKDLADNSQTPAEKFEYAPELIFKMPQSFNLKRTRWKEVSP